MHKMTREGLPQNMRISCILRQPFFITDQRQIKGSFYSKGKSKEIVLYPDAPWSGSRTVRTINMHPGGG